MDVPVARTSTEVKAKVFEYKSCGEPFLWNRFWYLGWFWASFLAIMKISEIKLKYAIFESRFFLNVFMGETNKKKDFLDIVECAIKSYIT